MNGGVARDETRLRIAHLYRRAGFGATADELDAAVSAGYDATVDRLVDLSGPDAGADRVAAPTFAEPVPAARCPPIRRPAARPSRRSGRRSGPKASA